MKKKFLVISPHPDDLDFGCAGTIAKLVLEGSKVSYLIVSDGSKGGRLSNDKLKKVREKEQGEAARVLGVTDVGFLGLKDGEVENTKYLRRELVRAIRRTKPDIVLSFDPASLDFDNFYRSHRDHRQTAEAVFDAVYPAAGNHSFFPELLGQGYKPHEPEEVWFFATNKPDKIVNITATIGNKVKALSCHSSQISDIKKVEKMIKDRARAIGKRNGYQHGESFRVVKFHR